VYIKSKVGTYYYGLLHIFCYKSIREVVCVYNILSKVFTFFCVLLHVVWYRPTREVVCCGEPAISLHSHTVSLVQWVNPLLPLMRDPGSIPRGVFM
jgi:hypothetical protein